MVQTTVLSTCAVLIAPCGGELVSYAELSRLDQDRMAIDGYSPVSYFTEGKAECFLMSMMPSA